MDRPTHLLTHADVQAAGLPDWRLLLRALHTRFRTGGFGAGLALVNRVGEVAEELDHHPDLDLRWGHLDVRLFSHDVGGVTERDVDLARRISDIAAGLGVVADPGSVQVVEIGLDTPARAVVRPFWQAVLGSGDGAEDEVVDREGRSPALWFQDTGSEAPDRQRFHLDVTVPPEVARLRVEAALAAGGRLVSEDEEPAFVVLEDPDGNRTCICTSLGRD
ncbi:MAG: 4a-hydroxytetrahydrobiopterin dehydratase [Nocardioidaceae bacterium]